MLKRILSATLLFTSVALVASSYRSVKGEYKSEQYKLRVEWADIYNVRPRPVHITLTEIEVSAGVDLQSPGYCDITFDGKKSVLKNGRVSIQGRKLAKFRLTCTFKSGVNKSMTMVDAVFEITQPTLASGSPFEWPLKVIKK